MEKQLSFCKDYVITTEGKVISYKKYKEGKELCPDIRRGYYVISLVVNGKKISKSVHRLVAETFIPNPLGLPQVNHIDGNKLNNNIHNLEWCTRSENMLHAHKHGLVDLSSRFKKVGRYSLDGHLIKVYNKIRDIIPEGFKCGAVVRCCKHQVRHKTHKGFKWEYL